VEITFTSRTRTRRKLSREDERSCRSSSRHHVAAIINGCLSYGNSRSLEYISIHSSESAFARVCVPAIESFFLPPKRWEGGRGGVVVDISVGIRYSRILLACECERGKFTSRRRRSAVSRHFRRRRLYDRRIYTIVGSYTRKLLTCAVCTYVRRRVCRYAAREKKLDELRERLRRGVE